MAESKKISQLTSQTDAPHTDDMFVIVDGSDDTQATSGSTKSITFGQLKTAIEEDGPQGHQGHQGTAGTPGAPSTEEGPQGHQGHQGTAGADSTVRGHQGHQGHQGNKGDDGDTPTSVWSGNTLRFDVGNVQGPISPSLKGSQGHQGHQGNLGNQGAVGATFNYNSSSKILTITT